MALSTKFFQEMIDVFKLEFDRRSKLRDSQNPALNYDQLVFEDEPFINELCLMTLVTLRHEIDRQIALLAARSNQKDNEISVEQYRHNVKQLQAISRNPKKFWGEIWQVLDEDIYRKYKEIEALRLISNEFKHGFFSTPDEELLRFLSLNTSYNYAPLSESDELRKGLAIFIGISPDADYFEIVNKFVEIAHNFLTEMEKKTKPCKIKGKAVSFNPDTFLR